MAKKATETPAIEAAYPRRVRALKPGWDGQLLREVGEVFTIQRSQQFSTRWMADAAGEPETRTPAPTRSTAYVPMLQPNGADPIDDDPRDTTPTGSKDVLG